jgi:hypothetical protein
MRIDDDENICLNALIYIYIYIYIYVYITHHLNAYELRSPVLNMPINVKILLVLYIIIAKA